jgi:hypothetical protein
MLESEELYLRLRNLKPSISLISFEVLAHSQNFLTFVVTLYQSLISRIFSSLEAQVMNLW